MLLKVGCWFSRTKRESKDESRIDGDTVELHAPRFMFEMVDITDNSTRENR